MNETERMMDKIELAICSLEMLRALMLFDPLTGEDISLDSLNRDNRELYDSAAVAITALTEQAERSKGCVWCKSDSQVTHNGEHFCFFCSYCGKRLDNQYCDIANERITERPCRKGGVVMNELSQAIAQEKDKLLFELFKKYGYSRKKAMDAFTRDSVKLMVQGNRETYYIDGKELFTIEKTVQQNDEKHTFTFREVE